MIYEKLQMVQSKMKAPKNLYNSFGKYNYRNAESILEAFKPFGKELGLALLLNDTVEEIGGRVYIKATATLVDLEDSTTANHITVSAYAREPMTKKGMDDSQVTGATSSYARKYCLNGLFLLDDTKDADTDEYRNESQARQKKQEPARIASDSQIKALVNTINKKNLNLQEVLYRAKVDSLEQLTPEKYNRIVMVIKDM